MIHIIATGGTIDKIHDPITEKLVFSEKSKVAEIVSAFNIPDLEFSEIMLKDSFDVTDDDRHCMLEAIQNTAHDKIIITHGTSTMVETAQFLSHQNLDKTIVLTGAMRPYTFYRGDAQFNLGCAISATRLADQGVYIAMNGQVFTADNVTKNTEIGVFE